MYDASGVRKSFGHILNPISLELRWCRRYEEAMKEEGLRRLTAGDEEPTTMDMAGSKIEASS